VTEVLASGANDVYVTSTGLCIPALRDVVAKVEFTIDASRYPTWRPTRDLQERFLEG